MIAANYLHRPDFDNFVLVYTMGKVGSTSLAHSLGNSGIFARHLQWLTPETQAFMDKLPSPAASDIDLFLNRLNVERCRYALQDRTYASLIKVITGFRAPVELILSHYFHAIAFFESQLRRRGQDVTADTLRANILDGVDFYLRNRAFGIAELTERLCEANQDRVHFHWSVLNCLDWLDFELRPFFPVEIREGFGTKGYVLAGNVLILKFEELATKGEEAARVYTQRPQFKLAKVNVGAEKVRSEIYRDLLNTLRFPAEFVDHLCNARYVRLLYTAEERAAMKARWVE